ncbi:MAG: HD domain-containing protein [Oscillospiraceae bacterium]|jgi:HD-GYP domain-containing protein (c-di-GMP phosphodiesterase class II)|nr:HD domain-containing protein [Oscillospiraceae bacterium]
MSNDSTKNDNVLRPVSISLLYDGMVVQDDIYDATGDRMLIKAGNELGVLQIERIMNLNNNRDTIYVTGRTQKAMASKRPPDIEVESRTEVEEATGYAETKNETFEILEKISNSKTVDQASLKEASSKLSNKLETTPPTVIISLINAMAPVDEYLQRHCVNVSLLNGLIGMWMGLPKEEVDKLVLIGLLHDSGKSLLPPAVLNVPRRLTKVEFEVIKMHTVYTYELLKDFPEDIRISAASHHEKLNGKGYPQALSDDAVPRYARITAVTDIYDAMVSQRAYKQARGPFSILALIKKLSVSELDNDIINIFIENMPKELMNKPVMMSDGTIGVIKEFDPNDIEFPTVELGKRLVKTTENLQCVSMFTDE